MSKAESNLRKEWRDVPWPKLEVQTYKLQTRIYRAAQRGDKTVVNQLQKTLLSSRSAKYLAVRKVTQDNRGKTTAGIDGRKSLSPTDRLELAETLALSDKSSPVRRVWIPKPGKDEQRPLGIPTIEERAKQALVKLALEPEWEAKFEPHSYGFRPGKSAHDAVKAIQHSIKQKDKYVLDADISYCFDNICHQKLLDKVDTFPSLRRQLKAWLKAGLVEGNSWYPTSEGTPQGGIISPLLANIALHGMEHHLQTILPKRYPTIDGKRRSIKPPLLVRYADDFVVLHSNLDDIQIAQAALSSWLGDMGLSLHPEKTRITHTLHPHDGHVGFDFLGFHIQQHPVGKHLSAKGTVGNHLTGRTTVNLGFKTYITISKQGLKRHVERVKTIVDKHSHSPQEKLIAELNPVLQGWMNYYSYFNCRNGRRKATYLTFQKLRSWAVNRCTNRGLRKVANKYWKVEESGQWIFSTSNYRLIRQDSARTQRYVPVNAARSPYDGDSVYWTRRLGRHPGITIRVAKLLKAQAGQCSQCKLLFTFGDRMEVDHIVPRVLGGPDTYDNLQLLHAHCHDVKTALDGSNHSKQKRYLELP